MGAVGASRPTLLCPMPQAAAEQDALTAQQGGEASVAGGASVGSVGASAGAAAGRAGSSSDVQSAEAVPNGSTTVGFGAMPAAAAAAVTTLGATMVRAGTVAACTLLTGPDCSLHVVRR